MGRYERGDDVWQIERDGTRITVTGADGQASVEELADSKTAALRFNILVNQQTRAGWKLAKPKPIQAEVEPASVLPAQPIVHDARNPELEALLRADPESTELYVMYGDWLQRQGDPRGELIALQAAQLARPNDHKLERMVRSFLKKHDVYFHRANDTNHQLFSLHLGFIRGIVLEVGPLVAPLHTILAVPAARFVVRITLDDETASELGPAIELLAAEAPPTVRELTLGGRTTIHSLALLAPRFAELHSLRLTTIAEREVVVPPTVLAELAAAKLPKLETLELDLLYSTANLPDVTPILRRADLAAVTQLHLRSAYDAGLVRELAESPLASQLRVLTLEQIGGADGAKLLVELAPKFPRLETLSVSQRYFPRDAFGTLRLAFKAVADFDEHGGRYESGYE